MKSKLEIKGLPAPPVLIQLILFLFLISCQATLKDSLKPPAQCDTWKIENLTYASQKASEDSMSESIPQKKMEYAKKGILWADRCIHSFPDSAACYYYRAVNTGLYYKVKGLGYQGGLKEIIADCQKVVSLDPRFEAGGGYRILGNIYLKVPSFALSKNSIVKDMARAKNYAKQALDVDSFDLENRLLWADVLLEEGNYEEAKTYFKSLQEDYAKIVNPTFHQKENIEQIQEGFKRSEKRS